MTPSQGIANSAPPYGISTEDPCLIYDTATQGAVCATHHTEQSDSVAWHPQEAEMQAQRILRALNAAPRLQAALKAFQTVIGSDGYANGAWAALLTNPACNKQLGELLTIIRSL